MCSEDRRVCVPESVVELQPLSYFRLVLFNPSDGKCSYECQLRGKFESIPFRLSSLGLEHPLNEKIDPVHFERIIESCIYAFLKNPGYIFMY
jgi:hypothetical protein